LSGDDHQSNVLLLERSIEKSAGIVMSLSVSGGSRCFYYFAVVALSSQSISISWLCCRLFTRVLPLMLCRVAVDRGAVACAIVSVVLWLLRQ